jgi:tetratricopeptide (TPR) repeat protein
LARSYGHYGDLLRNKKRPAEALARYDLATTQLEAIVARSASLPRDRSLLRETHSNRAECLTELQRHAEAVNAWDRVIEVVPETDRPTYRLQRAESLARAGEHAKAIAEAEAQLRGEKADSDSDTLYNCACVFALCSAGSKDIALREQHADRAMALMKKAAAAGFSDAEYLKAENDFASLRTRTDFKHLVAEMEKKTSPKQDK